MKFLAIIVPLFLSLAIAAPLAAPEAKPVEITKRVPQNKQDEVDVATASMVDANGNIVEFNPDALPARK